MDQEEYVEPESNGSRNRRVAGKDHNKRSNVKEQV
jgi:hypothetical protein